MEFEILENGQVLKVETTKTETQTAITKTAYGWKNRVYMSADKTQLALNETAIIHLKWALFDINVGDWVDDPDNTDDFVVEVNGQTITIPVSDGAFEFESAEPGEYVIRTKNVGVDNAEIKVVVS